MKLCNFILHPKLKAIIVIVLLTSVYLCSFSQIQTHTPNGFDSLKLQYQSGKIDDTTYMNKVIQLSNLYNTLPSLKNNLAHFRELAVSDIKFKKYRVYYFTLLANNAMLNNNNGDHNLYLAKAQNEVKTNPDYISTHSGEKKHGNTLMVLLAIILGISLVVLSAIMLKREKIAKKNIEHLNYESQLQIAELEERNRIAKMEEQQRLSMELHDDISGNIAFIKTKIESSILENNDIAMQNKLQEINGLVKDIYEKTRNKSHQWYNFAKNESRSSFINRIKNIADNGLPENKHKKRIAIEDISFENISLQIKIEILYIVQEAITNIVKHSGAHIVDIMIYRDFPGLILQIADDGKGFDTTKKSNGIGLQSIKQRVGKLQGNVEINSGKNGTNIKVIIPLTEKN